MPRTLTLSAVALSLLPALVQAQPSPSSHSGTSTATPSPSLSTCEVSDPGTVARMAWDVGVLSSDAFEGRAPGTPGGSAAMEFLVRQLTAAGVEPAGTEGFYQPFTVTYGTRVGRTTLTLRRGALSRALSLGPELQPADGTSTGTVDQPLVFVGHGISARAHAWEDYGDATAARGRVVVLLEGAPRPEDPARARALGPFGAVRYQLRVAREHGAVGAIVVSLSEGALTARDLDPTPMGLPAVRVSRAQGAWLLGVAPEALGPATAPAPPRALDGARGALTTEVTGQQVPTANVVGRIRGTGAPGPGVLVVGAHHDHVGHGGRSSLAPGSTEVHNGADDNGSGTTVVLELARRFALAPLARDVVVVFFGAEELGLLGSQHFVANRPPAARDIAAMVNLDMVGRLRDCRLFVENRGSGRGLDAMVDDANGARGFDARPWEPSRGPWGASDHESFQRARVPNVFLFTGLHEDYHRPADDAPRLNLRGMASLADFAEALSLSMASSASLVFQEETAQADPHSGGRGGGFRVSLGTIPDYGAPGPGVRLSGVRPDGAAAAAGLQGGDVIVELAGHAIGNIYDYTYALGELEPGVEVPVVVQRGGQRVTLRVVPAPGR